METSPPVRIILASKNRDEKIEAVMVGEGGEVPAVLGKSIWFEIAHS